MRWKARLGAALAGGAVLAVAGLPAVPAGAAELQDSGWWWRANPGGASVTPAGLPEAGVPGGAPETPPPPDVPEGGLAVERAPDGAAAVAAIRFALGEDGSGAVLELQASSTQGVPELVACRAGSPWSGADAGRWDSRPHGDCEALSVTGEEGEEGSWTFAVGTLAGDGDDLDVVVVPAPAEAGVAAPFRVVFEPVTAASLRTTPGGGDFDFDPGAFDGGGADSAGVGSGTGSFSPGTGGGIDLGAGPSLPDVSGPATGGDTTGAPAAASGGRGPAIPVGSSAPFVPDDGTATTAAVAVLVLGTAVLYAAVRRPVPALESLVPLRAVRRRDVEPTVHVGGLGRFARPRERAPIRLG